MNEIPFSLSVNTETIVAMVTLAGVILSVGFAHAANKNAGEANRAVNNRPAGEPSIYKLVHDTFKKVVHIDNWKDSYDGGPLDSGPKVEVFVDGVIALHKDVKGLHTQLDALNLAVIKYGCPVKLGQEKECPNEVNNEKTTQTPTMPV